MDNFQQKFVVITYERTGSTMLCQSLHRLPEVTCFGELFNRFNKVPWWLEQSFENGLEQRFLGRPVRDQHPVAFLNAILDVHRNDSFFGFKLMLDHDPNIMKLVIDSPEWKVVRLYRQNLLSVYGSSLVAKATKKSHFTPEQELRHAKVTFCPRAFDQFRMSIEKRQALTHEMLHAAGKSYFCLEYKDLVSDSGLHIVASHLGISSSVELQPVLVKRHSWDVLERFENPDDVRRYLKVNALEHWTCEGS
ncbi:MAG: hypothetical protein AAGB35_10140 [Pseudomonadota bacterium]